MKGRPRVPKREEKKILDSHKLDWHTWLVEKVTADEIGLISKKSGIRRTINLKQ